MSAKECRKACDMLQQNTQLNGETSLIVNKDENALGTIIEHITELEQRGAQTAFFTHGAYAWKCITPDEQDAASLQNFSTLDAALGTGRGSMIRSWQKHTGDVRVVDAAHAGEGCMRPVTTAPFDGVVTNTPGLLLCTTQADCLPIYLLDPVQKAIGMVHSGWRGTLAKIGPRALSLMQKEFGTQAHDVVVYLGPSICGTCYEVGSELRESFSSVLSAQDLDACFLPDALLPYDKYRYDNARAASSLLCACGVLPENIFKSPLCTFEDASLASYRRTGTTEGLMLTGIAL